MTWPPWGLVLSSCLVIESKQRRGKEEVCVQQKGDRRGPTGTLTNGVLCNEAAPS